LYDPQQAALAAINEHGIPYLRVAGHELAPWVHNDLARAVLSLPSYDVFFAHDTIKPRQINLHRPSYINGILIQSRGILQDPPYGRCVEELKPFLECRRVPGHFGGCCDNCKWPNAAISCTARNPNEVPIQVIGDDHLLEAAGVAADNPVELD
jgi:Protein of unknown function (DUF3716)